MSQYLSAEKPPAVPVNEGEHDSETWFEQIRAEWRATCKLVAEGKLDSYDWPRRG